MGSQNEQFNTSSNNYMDLTIRVKDGDKFKISKVTPEYTVAQLKAQIDLKFDIPFRYQMLIYRGKILEDEKSLVSYKIYKKHFLVCLERCPLDESSSSRQYLLSHPNLVYLRHEYQSTGDTGMVLDAYRAWDSTSLAVINANQVEFLNILNTPLTSEEIQLVTAGLSPGHARLEEYLSSATSSDIAELVGVQHENIQDNLQDIVNILRDLPEPAVDTMLEISDVELPDARASNYETAISRLQDLGLGFSLEACIQAYSACGEDEQLAAALLLSGTFR